MIFTTLKNSLTFPRNGLIWQQEKSQNIHTVYLATNMEATLCKRRIRTHGKAFLSVRLYLINVNETAEHFGSKFCVGPYMTPGKVYG